MGALTRTVYFDDFCRYYEKATLLQDRNIGSHTGRAPGPCVDDPLMDWITIYDCVERRYAGFSNALQQLWLGSHNPKRWQVRGEFDSLALDVADWLWVFLVHRLTGSGASFSADHGFRNSVVADMAVVGDRFEQRAWLLEQMREGRKVFTSIGNQIPAFPKPRPPYARASELYLGEYAIDLVHHVLELCPPGAQRNITDVVDEIGVWQRERGLKFFKFVLTAWVMDIAEYMPTRVSPASHVYYGANCEETFGLLFSDYRRSRAQEAMEAIVEACTDGIHPPLPYSLEDVCCDYVRYVECYVPAGYDHLEPWQVENASLVRDHPRHRSYHEVQARVRN